MMCVNLHKNKITNFFLDEKYKQNVDKNEKQNFYN